MVNLITARIPFLSHMNWQLDPHLLQSQRSLVGNQMSGK